MGFKILFLQTGAGCGSNVFEIGSVFKHYFDGVFNYSAQGSAPTGMSGTDYAVSVVSQQNRYAVGGSYS